MSVVPFVFGLQTLSAQQGAVPAGGDAAGPGGNVSYSIGQIDYSALSGPAGSVNAGLQQPYEIMVITGLDQKDIQLSCSVYPNPSSDFIILGIQSPELNSWSYELFDAHDKCLLVQRTSDIETRIPLAGLPNGIYILRLTGSGKMLKSFRIIKNQ